MSKTHLAKLREAVRVTIVEFFENKRGTMSTAEQN